MKKLVMVGLAVVLCTMCCLFMASAADAGHAVVPALTLSAGSGLGTALLRGAIIGGVMTVVELIVKAVKKGGNNDNA